MALGGSKKKVVQNSKQIVTELVYSKLYKSHHGKNTLIR